MIGAQILNLTATLGPFGLAFPTSAAASQRLACDKLRGRPFVTSLHVHRVSAPLGRREAYEFRIQCGNAWSEWTQLGPSSLVWDAHVEEEANCPRPQSASGLLVSRGREGGDGIFGWGTDLYGFSLMCGGSSVGVDALDPGDDVEERLLQRCPAESFVSAIEIFRGFERSGAYDLYEFRLECSELVDQDETVQQEQRQQGGYTRDAIPSRAQGATQGASATESEPEGRDRFNVGGRGRGGRRPTLVSQRGDEAADGAAATAAAATAAAAAAAAGGNKQSSAASRGGFKPDVSGGSGFEKRGSESAGAGARSRGGSAGDDDAGAGARDGRATGSSSGGGKTGSEKAGGVAGGGQRAGSPPDDMEALLEELLRQQRKTGGATKKPDREQMAKIEEADISSIFGSVRESAQKSEQILRNRNAHLEEVEAAAVPQKAADTQAESVGEAPGLPGNVPKAAAEPQTGDGQEEIASTQARRFDGTPAEAAPREPSDMATERLGRDTPSGASQAEQQRASLPASTLETGADHAATPSDAAPPEGKKPQQDAASSENDVAASGSRLPRENAATRPAASQASAQAASVSSMPSPIEPDHALQQRLDAVMRRVGAIKDANAAAAPSVAAAAAAAKRQPDLAAEGLAAAAAAAKAKAEAKAKMEAEEQVEAAGAQAATGSVSDDGLEPRTESSANAGAGASDLESSLTGTPKSVGEASGTQASVPLGTEANAPQNERRDSEAAASHEVPKALESAPLHADGPADALREASAERATPAAQNTLSNARLASDETEEEIFIEDADD